VALASCLQVDAVAANAVIQEQSLGIHYNEGSDVLDYLADPSVFDYEEGFVALPEAAGLGVDVDRDAIEAGAEEGHDWKSPVWRHDDGSVAEW
jgi:galactonate dehydratase